MPKVGDRIQVRCYRPGCVDDLLFTGVVVRMTKTRVIVENPRDKRFEYAFNARTGFEIGSTRTRGIGLNFNPRIVEIPQA